MEIKKISVSKLKKLENNPRYIKDDQFETLCKSIKDNPEYFEARPIICSDRTGELIIIAGNQRFEASKHIKMKEVPVAIMSGLTEEKEREIIIRDNVSNGEWDYDSLANEWDVDELGEWGLDLHNWSEEDDIDVSETKDQSSKVETAFKVEITCKNESEQEMMFNKLSKEGY